MLHRFRDQLLEYLVQAASTVHSLPPRKPWLEPLPERLSCAELDDYQSEVPTEARIGILDDPARQTQPVFSYRPAIDGNLLIIGAASTGKTTALQTIQHRLQQQGMQCFWISGGQECDPVLFTDEDQQPAVLIIDDVEQFREQYEFRSGSTLYQECLNWIGYGRKRHRFTVLSAPRVQAVPAQLVTQFRQQLFLAEQHPEQSRHLPVSYLAKQLAAEQPRIPGRAWIQQGSFRELQLAYLAE